MAIKFKYQGHGPAVFDTENPQDAAKKAIGIWSLSLHTLPLETILSRIKLTFGKEDKISEAEKTKEITALKDSLEKRIDTLGALTLQNKERAKSIIRIWSPEVEGQKAQVSQSPSPKA